MHYLIRELCLGKIGRSEEAIGIYEVVNVRYGEDTEPGVRKQVAMAMFNQGIALGEMGRSAEALQVYKQMDERYGKDTDPGVRDEVARSLVNQGVMLGKMRSF